MKVSVILGHPYYQSFNFAIAEIAVQTLKDNGYTVMFHDLCLEKFDPIMPEQELASGISQDNLIQCHQNEIKEADGIVIIHPNWWGQPPAILKGWVDRVLRNNIAYTFPEGDNGGGLPIGLLKAKTGLVFNTSNTPEERENNVFGDPLNRIWKDCIFDFCGVTVFDRIMLRVVADSDETQRKKWLSQVQNMVNNYFPKQE
jgi:putative NADPH-quinone reductase